MSISDPSPGTSPQQNLEAVEAGPAANEDLTIAELLKLHRLPDDDSDDALESFREPGGEIRQLKKTDVIRFLENYGPLHPGDYAEQEGGDWLTDFFGFEDSPPASA